MIRSLLLAWVGLLIGSVLAETGRQKDVPPLAFLKTHKTGSRTVGNVLFRIAALHGTRMFAPCHVLTFCDGPNAFSGKYEGKFGLVANHLTEPSLGAVSNVTWAHARALYRKVLGSDEFVFASSVREPLERYISHSRFYGRTRGGKRFDIGIAFDLGLHSSQDIDIFLQEAESMGAVFIPLERIYEGLAQLSIRLKLPVELFIPLNHEGRRKSNGAQGLEAKMRRMIEEGLSNDRRIYEWSLDRLDKALEGPEGKEIQERAEALRRLERAVSEECRQRKGRPMCFLLYMTDINYETFVAEDGYALYNNTFCTPESSCWRNWGSWLGRSGRPVTNARLPYSMAVQNHKAKAKDPVRWQDLPASDTVDATISGGRRGRSLLGLYDGEDDGVLSLGLDDDTGVGAGDDGDGLGDLEALLPENENVEEVRKAVAESTKPSRKSGPTKKAASAQPKTRHTHGKRTFVRPTVTSHRRSHHATTTSHARTAQIHPTASSKPVTSMTSTVASSGLYDQRFQYHSALAYYRPSLYSMLRDYLEFLGLYEDFDLDGVVERVHTLKTTVYRNLKNQGLVTQGASGAYALQSSSGAHLAANYAIDQPASVRRRINKIKDRKEAMEELKRLREALAIKKAEAQARARGHHAQAQSQSFGGADSGDGELMAFGGGGGIDVNLLEKLDDMSKGLDFDFNSLGLDGGSDPMAAFGGGLDDAGKAKAKKEDVGGGTLDLGLSDGGDLFADGGGGNGGGDFTF